MKTLLFFLLTMGLAVAPAPAALTLNGTSDEVTTTDLGSRLAGGSTATLAAWVYRGATGRHFDFSTGTSTTAQIGMTWYGSDNRVYGMLSNGSEVYVWTQAQALTGWHHIVVVFDGSGSGNAGRLKIYFDGAPLSHAGSQGTVPATVAASLGTSRIGRSSLYSRYSNAAAAEVAAWSGALTAAEVQALAAGFTPAKVRPGSLVAYLPLIGTQDDLKGNTWTAAGTTVSTHPPVRGK